MADKSYFERAYDYLRDNVVNPIVQAVQEPDIAEDREALLRKQRDTYDLGVKHGTSPDGSITNTFLTLEIPDGVSQDDYADQAKLLVEDMRREVSTVYIPGLDNGVDMTQDMSGLYVITLPADDFNNNIDGLQNIGLKTPGSPTSTTASTATQTATELAAENLSRSELKAKIDVYLDEKGIDLDKSAKLKAHYDQIFDKDSSDADQVHGLAEFAYAIGNGKMGVPDNAASRPLQMDIYEFALSGKDGPDLSDPDISASDLKHINEGHKLLTDWGVNASGMSAAVSTPVAAGSSPASTRGHYTVDELTYGFEYDESVDGYAMVITGAKSGDYDSSLVTHETNRSIRETVDSYTEGEIYAWARDPGAGVGNTDVGVRIDVAAFNDDAAKIAERLGIDIDAEGIETLKAEAGFNMDQIVFDASSSQHLSDNGELMVNITLTQNEYYQNSITSNEEYTDPQLDHFNQFLDKTGMAKDGMSESSVDLQNGNGPIAQGRVISFDISYADAQKYSEQLNAAGIEVDQDQMDVDLISGGYHPASGEPVTVINLKTGEADPDMVAKTEAYAQKLAGEGGKSFDVTGGPDGARIYVPNADFESLGIKGSITDTGLEIDGQYEMEAYVENLDMDGDSKVAVIFDRPAEMNEGDSISDSDYKSQAEALTRQIQDSVGTKFFGGDRAELMFDPDDQQYKIVMPSDEFEEHRDGFEKIGVDVSGYDDGANLKNVPVSKLDVKEQNPEPEQTAELDQGLDPEIVQDEGVNNKATIPTL